MSKRQAVDIAISEDNSGPSIDLAGELYALTALKIHGDIQSTISRITALMRTAAADGWTCIKVDGPLPSEVINYFVESKHMKLRIITAELPFFQSPHEPKLCRTSTETFVFCWC